MESHLDLVGIILEKISLTLPILLFISPIHYSICWGNLFKGGELIWEPWYALSTYPSTKGLHVLNKAENLWFSCATCPNHALVNPCKLIKHASWPWTFENNFLGTVPSLTELQQGVTLIWLPCNSFEDIPSSRYQWR